MWHLITHDLAIDLGTANTHAVLASGMHMLSEPTVVAVNEKARRVIAVGDEAKQMIGREPQGVKTMRPLRDGVISDFDATEALLRHFVSEMHKRNPKFMTIPRPRIILGVPSSITEVELNALTEAAQLAGARKIHLIEEAVAAALGSGLDIERIGGMMVVDIGGGTTDIAVLSAGGIVIDNTSKTAGDEMTMAIMDYARHKYQLQIGETLAERLKVSLGNMQVSNAKQQISGLGVQSGQPKQLEISATEVREALVPVVDEICASIRLAIEKSPPAIVDDLLVKGILLTGGGSLLANLDKYLMDKTRLPVVRAKQPLLTVVHGLKSLFGDQKLLSKMSISLDNFLL